MGMRLSDSGKVLILFFFLLAFSMAAFAEGEVAATSCKTDPDCAQLNHWIQEVKCIRNINDFDAERTVPDKDFTTLQIDSAQWSNFVKNGVKAGFAKTGKKYTWYQQEQFFEQYVCKNSACVMKSESEVKGKKCSWACDVPDGIGNSNRCMCERLYEDLSCNPDDPNDPDIYERYQGVFKGADDVCKKDYERYYVCEGLLRCAPKGGKFYCLSPEEYPELFKTYNAAYFPSSDRILTGYEVSTAEFIEKYGYSPLEPPSLAQQQGLETASAYGLDRVLLEWDSDKITDTMCDPLLKEGESGYFCDATQFSVMLSNRISSGGDLAGLSVLLLADNYSDSFKSAFTEYYSGQFFKGKKIDISQWSFKNSPAEPGYYNVKTAVDGETATVEFSLTANLEKLDSDSQLSNREPDLGFATKFAENPLLKIAFDAFSPDKERDFGLVVKGESFYLNDNVQLPASKTVSSKLETQTGKTFADT
ncbi:MAG: hypothetical protein NT067_06125, partial [Candidatus Diapherotrites archaeon]|nr:hypothetical protein [Candidatus Diapherotrites archaeon]